ncbi:MAG: PLP-dependent aminotransferase family protein [Burkholderiaceae bacterium]
MNDTAIPDPGAALARGADSSLTEQLATRFSQRIRQHFFAPGARLPSVRECARRHNVSPSTVVAAYDQLQAQGMIEARRRRGFFVRSQTPESGAAVPQSALPPSHAPLPISATTLIRGMFQPPRGHAMPGLGTLPIDWLDSALLCSALRKVARSVSMRACLLEYGEPAGDARLRRALAARLADHGVNATAQQIVTTIGATHGLDVVTRTLLRPGDSVLVDEPGWSVEYARLAHLGMRVLPVPRGDDGPDLTVMQRLIDAQRPQQRPRLYVTVSVLHNPTSASLSLQMAHRVLQLAQRNDLHIVEDDSYAYLAAPHLPRLAALDALERTIYVGGFSKILTPGWRVGFIAAPHILVDRLIDTKLLGTLTTPALTESALAVCLEQGLLRRHAERVNAKLDAARARTVKLAQAHDCRFAAPPRGLFGWVDTGVDTERLAHTMLEAGWLLAPGALFHATHRATTLMRINFASSQDLRFWRDFARTRNNM